MLKPNRLVTGATAFGVAVLVGVVGAQVGRGTTEWLTAGGDAQRTFWIRTDPKISVASMSQPGFERQWSAKLDNQTRGRERAGARRHRERRHALRADVDRRRQLEQRLRARQRYRLRRVAAAFRCRAAGRDGAVPRRHDGGRDADRAARAAADHVARGRGRRARRAVVSQRHRRTRHGRAGRSGDGGRGAGGPPAAAPARGRASRRTGRCAAAGRCPPERRRRAGGRPADARAGRPRRSAAPGAAGGGGGGGGGRGPQGPGIPGAPADAIGRGGLGRPSGVVYALVERRHRCTCSACRQARTSSVRRNSCPPTRGGPTPSR